MILTCPSGYEFVNKKYMAEFVSFSKEKVI
jgi:hypothetical protein